MTSVTTGGLPDRCVFDSDDEKKRGAFIHAHSGDELASPMQFRVSQSDPFRQSGILETPSSLHVS